MVSENEEMTQRLSTRAQAGRLARFEPREARAARGSGGEACAEQGRSIIRAGKNTKVSVLAERIIERFLEQGLVELETVGAGAVNQAVKAVARARQALEPEGYALAIIPELVQVLLGHGSQTVVHLVVIDMYGG